MGSHVCRVPLLINRTLLLLLASINRHDAEILTPKKELFVHLLDSPSPPILLSRSIFACMHISKPRQSSTHGKAILHKTIPFLNMRNSITPCHPEDKHRQLLDERPFFSTYLTPRPTSPRRLRLDDDSKTSLEPAAWLLRSDGTKACLSVCVLLSRERKDTPPPLESEEGSLSEL